MPLEEFLLKYWTIITAAVIVIVWAIRIEGALKTLGQQVLGLKETRTEDQELASESRKEVHETLRVIQKDIKDILRATAGK